MEVRWGYGISLIVASIISIIIARIAWGRRPSPGSIPLSILMGSLAIWSLLYALHWLRVPEPRAFFWLDLTYIGVVTVPSAFFLFISQISGRLPWLQGKRSLLLIFEPLLTFIILMTNSQHGLFFGSTVRTESEAILSGGIWFNINVIYSYALIGFGLIIVLQSLPSSKGLYRHQRIAIVYAALFPVVVNILGLAGLIVFADLDLTPITFTLTGAIFAAALFRLGLLNIVPIARRIVVEEMQDGVFVLDSENRLVDINPAARRMMGLNNAKIFGKNAHQLLGAWPELREKFRDTSNAREEIRINSDEERVIDLSISPLSSGEGLQRGRIILMRDVSERAKIEEELYGVNRRLQAQLRKNRALRARLQEEVIRDPLTGLYNRRYLEESLDREIARMQRVEAPLCLAMLDVDKFKDFNDNYGHKIGDKILKVLASVLVSNTRAGDIACRFGGEEFIVVLPETSQEIAQLRIDYFRQTFEGQKIRHKGEQLSCSLSAGLSFFPEHGRTAEELINAADMAMYEAKKGGRNQVVAAG